MAGVITVVGFTAPELVVGHAVAFGGRSTFLPTSILPQKDVAASGAIPSGGSAHDLTIGTPGQNARFSFNGHQGQTVSLQLTHVQIGPGGQGDPTCCVYDVAIIGPDGQPVPGSASGDYTGTGDESLDPRKLPSDGSYSVVVDPHGANTGHATVTLLDR
ncbi:MAG: hypothetical protein M3083_15760 [Actinomycetota bacterium]|nr:hypothetical protein [Actinomycetota bacterium]